MTKPNGNPNAKVMIVGEAPGKEEDLQGTPFVGGSGRFLAKLLSHFPLGAPNPPDSAGPRYMEDLWASSDIFLTNVAREKPQGNDIKSFFANKTEGKKEGLWSVHGRYPREPIRQGMDMLYDEIVGVDPNVIIALGDTALWALTGQSGITSWRGSQMDSVEINGKSYYVVPTLHPAAILRQYSWKQLFLHDISERVVPFKDDPKGPPKPAYNFIVRPSFDETVNTLDWLLDRLDSYEEGVKISSDIETRFGHIACEGLAWSDKDAISIPIMQAEHPYHYWNDEEEAIIVDKIKKIHVHPNAAIVGQNFNFDRQHFALYWGFKSGMYMDTMTAHHTCWPNMQKSLEFLSSLYCAYHQYWKDESGEWDPSLGEEQLWVYNCKDVCVTYEVSDRLEETIERMGIEDQYNFQMRMNEHVFDSWIRGVRYDDDRRRNLGLELMQEIQRYQAWFVDFLGIEKLKPTSKSLWCDSPDQLRILFYDIMGVKPVLDKKTKRPTTGKEALPVIKNREPLLAPIIDALEEYRSLSVYYSNFISVNLDPFDGRWRQSLNVDGTSTFRMSSSNDAFKVGANIQNVPKGEEED